MDEHFLKGYFKISSKTLNNSKSILNLQKSICGDFNLGNSKTNKFIPFLKERDGVGKLIKYSSEERLPKSNFASISYQKNNTSKQRLLKKVIFTQCQPIFPSVGSYQIPQDWIKKSFSVKNTKSTKGFKLSVLPNSQQVDIQESNKPQKIQQEKYKIENAIDRKAKRISVQRPLGVWECLKIYGTPDEFKEEPRNNEIKSIIKSYDIEIKRLFNELKK